jgi:hypothetical protein
MQYREDKKSGNKLSALGLGCMRFPLDKRETERMILRAIEGGVNFFDTAYIYPNSEATLGSVLAKHGKRKDVFIATKIPMIMCKSAQDFYRLFSEQLRRLQTDYIDYYFVHNITDFARWNEFRALGFDEWVEEKKQTGQIKQIGFSFHGSGGEFLKILESYPWQFCMIQYNYYDENYQAGRAGLRVAAERNIPVIIMEPLLGGKLATGLPKQAVQMFADLDPALTPADRALWWLWNQDEVTVVLSGMSSTAIMESNLRSVDSFRPLTEAELAVYADVVALFRKSYKIPCTSCNYCLPCPKGINIPSCFSAYNASYSQGFITGASLYMTSIAALTKEPGSPRRCNGCGVCEKQCPQFIEIRKALKKTGRRFEPLPIRMIMSLARKIMVK